MYANELSNENGSLKSCKGVFKTEEQYFGSFGKSMRIRGLDVGLNDHARERNIVFHPIPEFKIKGYKVPEWLLWYSDGCFAARKSNMDFLTENYCNGKIVVVVN